MRIFFISLVLILSVFFMGFKLFNRGEVMVPKEEQVVNSLIGRAAETLKQKYKMKPIGTTVSMPRCVVKNLGVHFQIHGPVTRSEIRKVLVEVAKDFLSMVNEDLELRPLLESYPFSAKNIDIALFIKDDTGKGIRDPYISYAGIRNGKLDYVILDETDVKDEFIESYEDALNALQRH